MLILSLRLLESGQSKMKKKNNETINNLIVLFNCKLYLTSDNKELKKNFFIALLAIFHASQLILKMITMTLFISKVKNYSVCLLATKKKLTAWFLFVLILFLSYRFHWFKTIICFSLLDKYEVQCTYVLYNERSFRAWNWNTKDDMKKLSY